MSAKRCHVERHRARRLAAKLGPEAWGYAPLSEPEGPRSEPDERPVHGTDATGALAVPAPMTEEEWLQAAAELHARQQEREQ